MSLKENRNIWDGLVLLLELLIKLRFDIVCDQVEEVLFLELSHLVLESRVFVLNYRGWGDMCHLIVMDILPQVEQVRLFYSLDWRHHEVLVVLLIGGWGRPQKDPSRTYAAPLWCPSLSWVISKDLLEDVITFPLFFLKVVFLLIDILHLYILSLLSGDSQSCIILVHRVMLHWACPCKHGP